MHDASPTKDDTAGARPAAAVAEETPLDQASIRRIIIGVMLAMLLSALDQTIVATALPTIGSELNDIAHAPWVVTAYLLSATAVTPLYGKLADIIGRRSTMLTAIIIFLVGSVFCAVAWSMPALIVARFIQGLGGGALIALAQTVVADVVPPIERMRYQAYFASVFVTSSFAGPVLGGFFAEYLHWSFIFWINLPLGLLAYWMTNDILRRLPRVERPHKLDVLGAVLMTLATVTLLLALSWGGTAYPWSSAEILGLFAVSLAAWALFTLRMMRAAEPFLPLPIMFERVVGTGTASAFFVVGTMMALSIYMPIYFETIIGLSAGQSGVALIALVGGTVIGAQLAARTMVWTPHYKRGPLIGLAIAFVGLVWLAIEPGLQPFWLMEVVLLFIGAGLGTIFPVTTVAIQNAVEPHQLGTATASYNFFRSLGSAIFVAGFGALLLGLLGVGGQQAQSLEALVADAATRGVPLEPVFGWIFAAAAALVAVGYLFMVIMPERPLRGRAPAPLHD